MPKLVSQFKTSYNNPCVFFIYIVLFWCEISSWKRVWIITANKYLSFRFSVFLGCHLFNNNHLGCTLEKRKQGSNPAQRRNKRHHGYIQAAFLNNQNACSSYVLWPDFNSQSEWFFNTVYICHLCKLLICFHKLIAWSLDIAFCGVAQNVGWVQDVVLVQLCYE